MVKFKCHSLRPHFSKGREMKVLKIGHKKEVISFMSHLCHLCHTVVLTYLICNSCVKFILALENTGLGLRKSL